MSFIVEIDLDCRDTCCDMDEIKTHKRLKRTLTLIGQVM